MTDIDFRAAQNCSFSVRSGKLVLFLVVVAFALLPLYLFPSGGFQLADAPIFVLMGYIVMSHCSREIQVQSNVVGVLFVFLFWVIAVNITHYLLDHNSYYLSASLQMCYTVILFITFSLLFYRILIDRDAIRYLYVGILLSVILPLLVRGDSPGFLARHSLSFNNPNQLASFALTMVATILVLNHFVGIFHPLVRSKKIVQFTTIFVIALGHYYLLLSASRAGLIGLAYLDLIAIWKSKKLVLAIIILAVILIPMGSFLSQSKLTETMIYKRLVGVDLYSKLADRTEGRFKFGDLSLIYGSGKTNAPHMELKEVHNTLGDLFYSYGLIGGALFLLFILFYLEAGIAISFNVLVLISFLPMHISHNLVRFRTIWIFYALVYSACLIYIHSSEARRQKGRVISQSGLAMVANG